MDFSDSMMGIVRKEFPQAEIVTDLFHVMQIYGTKGLNAMRMKLKRANTTEVKRQRREFKKRQEQNAWLRFLVRMYGASTDISPCARNWLIFSY